MSNDAADAMAYAFSGFDKGQKDFTGYYYPPSHECQAGEPRLFNLPHFRFWVYRCVCGKGTNVTVQPK